MAQTYSNELAGQASVPTTKANTSDGYGGRPRRYRATIDLAAQASGDTIVLAEIPANSVFAFGVLNSSVSLGTATLAVGDASSATKYRAASTFTATDTPTLFGNAAGAAEAKNAASNEVIATIGTASLPASGTLVVDLYFSGV